MDSNPQTPSAPVVLVTGAAQRIGRDIALAFARAGWDVGVHYRHSVGQAANLVQEIQAMGRRAAALQADLSDETQTVALPAQCAQALALPTCLVNNASLFDFDDAASFDQARLQAHMRVNVGAPVLLARELHRLMPDTARGVVVNLLDQKLDNPNPDFLSYTLSKAALRDATTLLAQALAPRLRIVAVSPGLTLLSGDQHPDNFARVHNATLLGRGSTAQDVAQAVLYLAQAPAVTGTVLVVDGGQHLTASPRDVMFTH